MERDPLNDDRKDIDAIQLALSQGITHIDTAESYAAGYAEMLVAKSISDFPREQLFLASKVYGTHLSYEDVLTSCKASLERLKTDYLDLYYIHFRNPEIPLQQTATALNLLLREGQIKNIGVYNFSVQSMKDLQSLLDAPIAANQSHYSLVYREPERAGLLDYCKDAGALFIAWRPLLWSDPNRSNQPIGNAWQHGIYPELDKISDHYGKLNVQVALNWLIGQPNICTLVKTTQPNHLEEIMGCLSWNLSSEHIETLRANFADQRDVSCAVSLG